MSSSSRRVALVIGNSTYQSAERLANPANDARAIAASFRRLGFAEVIEKYDANLAAMTGALKDFGDRTTNADWAVVYYEAMLANLEEPGLEINFLFRKVRDQVLATTNGRQEPFLYGSLPSESLFFKFAAPR